MLRRLSVRGKILATLAVPVLVLVFAAVFISAQSLREVQVARAISGALDALQVNRVFVEALQAEREAGVLHSGEIRLERRLPFLDEEERLSSSEERERRVRAEEREARFATLVETTDSTMSRAHDQLRKINFDVLDPLVREAVESTITAAERIPDVRASVRSGNLAPNLVDRQYSLVLTEIVQVVEQLAGTIDNRSLGTYLAAAALVEQTVERIVNERGFGLYALEGDGREVSARDYLVNLFPDTNSTQARARVAVANLGDPSIEMPDWGAESTAFTDFQNLRSRLQTSTLQDWEAVSEDLWVEQATIEVKALESTRSGLWSAAQRNAQAAQGAALSQATLTILLAVAALVVSVGLALLIARSIVVPLDRLTEAAAEVRDQLPRLVEQVATPGEGPDLTLVQIPVESTDEIGRLAGAFNEVNQKTIEVAQEQAALRGSIAEMFVNVARRDQVLLNRQLSFIDTLEREEEDPNTLANLFRLDHLATRMRRNAESLLVLAGIDSGRRVRGSMPLSDVIRTASSEIEQYDRINLQLGVDPQMHGFNSLPAAHLLAELMENATVFSEPGTPVDVVTSAEIEFITVTIIDRGLGMSTEDIKDANARIRESSATDVIGAQRLGLHVVARIATRLGTKVVFAKADGEGGTQVRVRFPRALFVDDAQDAQPHAGGRLLSAEELAAEAPAAQPVDLEALTDGTTGLGLPRRRASEPGPAPAAPAADPGIPVAPAASAPSETPSGLPSRRNIVLPEVQAPNLAPDVAAAAAGGWTPAVAAPAKSELPSRARGTTVGALPSDDGPVAPPRPAAAELAPEERSGMFAGFRRGSEALQQAQDDEVAPAAESEEQATEALPKRSEQQFTIPGLVPDEDEAPAASAPSAPEAPAYEPAEAYDSGQGYEQPAAEPSAEPAAAWGAPAPDHPVEQPAAWGAPAPEQPAEQWAPAPEQPAEPEPAAWGAPAAEAEPSVAWGQPAASPAWEPAAPQEAPAQPAASSWGPADPAWSPAEISHPSTPSALSPHVEAPQAEVPHAQAQPVEQLAPDAGQAPAEPQYPVFSPDAGYAPAAPAQQDAAWAPEQAVPALEPDPVPEAPAQPIAAATWSPADPAQPLDWGAAPAQPATPAEPAATPGWLGAASPQAPTASPHVEQAPAAPAAYSPDTAAPAAFPPATPAPAPVPAAASGPATGPSPIVPAAPLPSFADVVGQDGDAPSRRERRGDGKLSRAERRAAKRAEAKARAEEKALAKAEAKAAKKRGKKGSTSAPAPTPEPDAPSTGFFSQPTSIAALRAQSAPSAAVPAPAPVETPAPQTGWAPAPAPAPQAFEPAPAPEAAPQPAPSPPSPASPAPAPAAPAPAPAAGSQTFSPAPAAWTPGGGGPRQFGVLDDEVAAMLALRSDIQEQALSELSQLSAYRPQVVKPAASLQKRTPTAIPSAPEMEAPAGASAPRDPEQLRSRLSSFQSGATRGRRAGQQPSDPAPSAGGAVPQANGSAEHAASPAPSTDSTQEAQTW